MLRHVAGRVADIRSAALLMRSFPQVCERRRPAQTHAILLVEGKQPLSQGGRNNKRHPYFLQPKPGNTGRCNPREYESSLTFPSAVDTTVTCVVKSSSSSKEGSVMMVPSNTPQVKGKGTCRTTTVVGVSGTINNNAQIEHTIRQ